MTDSRNVRWFVCFLLFLATTINYMDRSVFSLIEPLLHNVGFMGWDFTADRFHQPAFDNHYGNIVICFQIAYGVGLLFAGRIIDRLGTKRGYALAVLVWGLSSMAHSLVVSVIGFCVARVMLGIAEAGNFPAAIKATTEWFPAEERALATGLFNSGSNFSALVAPALVAFVTLRFGWRAAFLATGSMGMVWLVLWLAVSVQQAAPRCHGDAAGTRARDKGQAATACARNASRHVRLLRGEGADRRRLVVLPLLPAADPQSHVRPLARRGLSLYRDGVPSCRRWGRCLAERFRDGG